MTTKSSASSYKRHDRKADDESSVWHYFLVEMPGKENAKCIKCDKILKTHSGSTGGLLKHLGKHQICLRKKVMPLLLKGQTMHALTMLQLLHQHQHNHTRK